MSVGSLYPDRHRPLVGVLCSNESLDRPVQTVATRFVEPLVRLAEVDVLLVPSVGDMGNLASLAAKLDGLLLTGSRSHVDPTRYGGRRTAEAHYDLLRDDTAFGIAGEMIERGKAVFGICRGLQELNVLFGGTLTNDCGGTHRHPGAGELRYEELFDHCHSVELLPRRLLNAGDVPFMTKVNSIHEQGISVLGKGLRAEAVADEGLIEAFSASDGGANVLAVQWHPECDVETSAISRRFFGLFGDAARGAGAIGDLPQPDREFAANVSPLARASR